MIISLHINPLKYFLIDQILITYFLHLCIIYHRHWGYSNPTYHAMAISSAFIHYILLYTGGFCKVIKIAIRCNEHPLNLRWSWLFLQRNVRARGSVVLVTNGGCIVKFINGKYSSSGIGHSYWTSVKTKLDF